MFLLGLQEKRPRLRKDFEFAFCHENLAQEASTFAVGVLYAIMWIYFEDLAPVTTAFVPARTLFILHRLS